MNHWELGLYCVHEEVSFSLATESAVCDGILTISGDLII